MFPVCMADQRPFPNKLYWSFLGIMGVFCNLLNLYHILFLTCEQLFPLASMLVRRSEISGKVAPRRSTIFFRPFHRLRHIQLKIGFAAALIPWEWLSKKYN